MSISNTAEMYLLATLANGDWTQWYRGGSNRGGLQPQLLTNPTFEGSSTGWTLGTLDSGATPSWSGNSGSYTQGWIAYSSNGWGYCSQTVTGLTVGETYHVIVDSYGVNAFSPQMYIQVTDGSTTHTSPTKTYWTANHHDGVHGLTFEAANSSVTVRVYGKSSTLSLYEVMMRKNDRWLALYTAAPNESGGHSSTKEVSGSGYARQPICFGWDWAEGGDGDDATMWNAEAIEFPEAAASWGTVSHIAVYSEESYTAPADNDAAQDEKYKHNVLFSMALDETKTVDTGDIVRFEQFTISLEADPQA